jgi:uncharacterized protein (DUF433 family)
MKDIFDKCLSEHPGVSAYDGILGGTAHVRGRRFSVGNVLARIYTHGSIQSVSEAYGIPEDELKEALAFAQDFCEDAFRRIVDD